MEDFLYILILVLWVVFTIYNKNRKKKQEASTGKPVQQDARRDTSQQRPRSILEQILMGEEPIPIPYEEHDQASEIQSFDSFEDEPIKKDNKEQISDNSSSKIYDFDPAKEAESLPMHFEYNEDPFANIDTCKRFDFDLRQAVIFSEILNRPYSY